jgi:uncharacterized membrane protein
MPTLDQRPEPELNGWAAVNKTNYVCHNLQSYYTQTVQPAISSRCVAIESAVLCGYRQQIWFIKCMKNECATDVVGMCASILSHGDH